MADEPQSTQPGVENEQELLDEIQQRKIQEHQNATGGYPDLSTDHPDQPSSASGRAAGQAQPYETQPPTEPAPGGAGPQDALAGSPQPPQATGGVAAERPGDAAGRPGPEDALDPRQEHLGDYSEPGRTDDAIHLHHEPVPEDELEPGGPRSRPVAQNALAEEHLSGLEQTAEQAAGQDPSADAARERAEAEQGGAPGENRQAAAEEQPGAGEQA